MAKQTGPYGFRGKLGDVVGRRINGQLIVGAPGGFTKETWEAHANDPDYAPRREAGEFGLSSGMARSIYHLCGSDLSKAHRDATAYNRLVSHFQKYRVLDEERPPGSRRPTPGAFYFLKGFSFNKKEAIFSPFLPFAQMTDEAITYRFDESTDTSDWPEEADEVEFIAYSAEIDFDSLSCIHPLRTGLRKTYGKLQEPFEFTIPRPDKNGLILMALRFFQRAKRFSYPLNNKEFSPFYVIHFGE